MELKLERFTRTDKTTIGRLSINGEFECYTLEDKDRGLKQEMTLEQIASIKVKTETCIPAGRYWVRKVFWAKHQKHFMQLQDVPGFAGIFIHSGNKAEDTEGCVLTGKTKAVDFVGSSRDALGALEQKVFYADSIGEQIWITIL